MRFTTRAAAMLTGLPRLPAFHHKTKTKIATRFFVVARGRFNRTRLKKSWSEVDSTMVPTRNQWTGHAFSRPVGLKWYEIKIWILAKIGTGWECLVRSYSLPQFTTSMLGKIWPAYRYLFLAIVVARFHYSKLGPNCQWLIKCARFS